MINRLSADSGGQQNANNQTGAEAFSVKSTTTPVTTVSLIVNQNMESVTSSGAGKTEDRNEVKLTANVKPDAKSNPEEYIDELSISVPGLTEAALGKHWNECELLLKKNLVLGCSEIKQLQYCMPYDDTIHKAVEKGFIDLIKLFIHNGYPCDTVLLLYALKHNKEDLVYLVIQKGADVNCKGSEEETPALLSAEKCSYEVMQLLISKGADINAKNNNNESVLHIAARRGDYNIVKFLLDDINDGNGSQKIRDDINLTNIHGQSALHVSVEENHYNIVQLLLDRGADIDLKDNDGCTALHICCKHENDSHLKVFTLLYERHANINVRNSKKKTPLILAAEHFNSQVFTE